MKFSIKKVEGQLHGIDHSPKTTFTAITPSRNIELKYNYIGEPNNGRIQLRLDFTINKKSVLDEWGIESLVELPYLYPRSFEILNASKNKVVIPHTQGVYILDLEKRTTNLVKYKSRDFQYSYFYKNELIVVESKFLTIVNLSTTEEDCIDLQKEGSVYINGAKILGEEIQVIVRNVDINESQLLSFSKANLSLVSTSNLSDIIKDEALIDFLGERRIRKLSLIPDFQFSSIIASWRFIPNIKKNSFVGSVQKWEEPINNQNIFERVEHFGSIELELFRNT